MGAGRSSGNSSVRTRYGSGEQDTAAWLATNIELGTEEW
jgi:hypothetical protein